MRLRAGEYYKKPYPIYAKAKPSKDERKIVRVEAPPKRVPTAQAVEAWDNKLRERVKEEIAAGREIEFHLASLRQKTQVLAVNDDGSLRVRSGPVTMDAPWSRFSVSERASLAFAVLREGNVEDHLMSAFFYITLGNEATAGEHLRMCGEFAAMIDEYFEKGK